MIYARIAGTGSFLPGEPVSNDDLVARGIETSDEWIVSRSGIRSRHLAAADVALSADELAQLGSVSQLPPEYPGWMFERQGEYRRQQIAEAVRLHDGAPS